MLCLGQYAYLTQLNILKLQKELTSILKADSQQAS